MGMGMGMGTGSPRMPTWAVLARPVADPARIYPQVTTVRDSASNRRDATVPTSAPHSTP
jgi:hypothetical protein